MRVLTPAEMRAVDQRAIDELHVPGLVLMENAALGVVRALLRRWPTPRRVLVLAGPGNNGGDGHAIARQLDARGIAVEVIAFGPRPTGDAGRQLEILEASGFPVRSLAFDAELDVVVERARDADLLVDALFGTGLGRPLTGGLADLIDRLATLEVPVLAVDLPSGLDGGRDTPIGPFLPADLTVTFAAPKIAHVMPPAADRIGELEVVGLGVSSRLVAEVPGPAIHWVRAAEAAAWSTPRVAESHKGTYGHVLLVGGRTGTSGAVVLMARAAVRGGAGLVTAAVPSSLVPLVDAGSIESMTLALSADAAVDDEALDAVLAAAEGKSAVAIGPGMGTEPATRRFVHEAVARLTVPVVLDADGINAYAGQPETLRTREAATILTPHPGELGRLLGISTTEVQAARLEVVREAARRTGCVVVLKGTRSLTAIPAGDIWVNSTGNPGMATGGSGDVLTGLIAALLGRGLDATVAAWLGVYLHGRAGDLAAAHTGEDGLAAADLVDMLPRTFLHEPARDDPSLS
ncbi:MAG: NAD(P)H-hydrate dehydratase [Acidobacteriota bacterium]